MACKRIAPGRGGKGWVDRRRTRNTHRRKPLRHPLSTTYFPCFASCAPSRASARFRIVPNWLAASLRSRLLKESNSSERKACWLGRVCPASALRPGWGRWLLAEPPPLNRKPRRCFSCCCCRNPCLVFILSNEVGGVAICCSCCNCCMVCDADMVPLSSPVWCDRDCC